MTPRPGMLEVSLGPIQEAFKASGLRPVDVARNLGWTDHRGYPDAARVTRRLGLRPVKFRRGGGKWESRCVQSTTYERAMELVEAIGCDPRDVGL